MDSPLPPAYLVGVGRRMLLVTALGSLLLLSPQASLAQDDDMVVFDLSTDHTVVDAHSAHFLYNLNTDNIDHVSAPIGWNSMYNRAGSEVSGRVVIDVSAGTVQGELNELWVCDGNCDDLDGETYADKMDAGWTATIDAYIETTGSTGSFTGTAELFYSVAVAYNETPSECGDEVCYMCARRVCVIAETMTGTAPIEGFWDGETLELSYADRLEADANDMDFDGLRDVQFIMGRASLTMTGVVPAAEAEPEPAPEQPASDSDDGSADTEEVDAQPLDEEAADAQPPDEEVRDETDPDAEPDDELETTLDDDIALNPVSGTESDLATKVVIALILCGLGILSWTVFRQLMRSLSPPKPPPPPRVDLAYGGVSTTHLEPDEPNPYVEYELVSTDGSGNVSGSGRTTKGDKYISQYKAGAVVTVIGLAGNAARVRFGSDPPIWVDRSNLKMIVRAGPTNL